MASESSARCRSHAAESALAKIRSYYSLLSVTSKNVAPAKNGTAFDSVISALCDDLNTPLAIGALFGLLNSIDPNFLGAKALRGLEQVLFALGLDLSAAAPKTEIPPAVAVIAEKRWAAKLVKDFATADTLRKELAAAGWAMLDRKDGYSLEPAKK